ncbi:MAG TPA: phage protein Gp27 family protein [Candidatus Binataceae bacterium]
MGKDHSDRDRSNGGAAADKPTESQRRKNHADLRHHKIRRLPKELKEELDRRLQESDFRSFRDLSKWLRKNGFSVSHQSLHKYGARFESMLEAVRIATEQAKVIVASAGDDPAKLDDVMMRMVQGEMFALLAKVHEAKIELDPPRLQVIVRSVAGLVETRLDYEKWQQHERDRIAAGVGAVQRKLDDAREKGLSPEAAEGIRSALLEIKV